MSPVVANRRLRAAASELMMLSGFVLMAASDANAASARVTMACASDYLAYCSRYPSDGPAVRQCMRANGSRLSRRCIDALVEAGEVSRAEVARREASAR